MKRSTYIWALFVALSATFLGCDRDNFDSGYEEFYGEVEPFVELDTAVNSFFRTASMNLPLVRGEGSVEIMDGSYFVEVKLTVKDSDQPFAMGWITDTLVPGVYEGAIFTLDLDTNTENSETLESGVDWTNGQASFEVKVNKFGEVGENITGTYSGEALQTGVVGLVPFEGAFNVLRVR